MISKARPQDEDSCYTCRHKSWMEVLLAFLASSTVEARHATAATQSFTVSPPHILQKRCNDHWAGRLELVDPSRESEEDVSVIHSYILITGENFSDMPGPAVANFHGR